MDTLAHVLNGFSVAIQPANLLYTFLGVLMGTMIGVMPGIGPAAGIALLIPVTFGMDSTSAIILMCGIYYGAMYGGSTTSILINTPGEASSMMTCIDGYQMAKKGRAGAALAISAWGSFISSTLGIIGLSLLAQPLSLLALQFGPVEYFSLMLFSLSAVSALSGRSPAKALISTILGLMIATIGVDRQSGMPRFTFGILELQDGIGLPVVAVGLFAVGEVFATMDEMLRGKAEVIRISGKLMLTRDEWRRSFWPIIRGWFIGFYLGVLPGAGATIATILSYATEKRLSRHPQEFGKGAIEGVAGPEAANNASAFGALVHMLTLGIPGSGTTAILLGVLIMYGIQPGPLLISQHPSLVWGLVGSMYFGNVILLILNLPLVGLFVRLLYVPAGILVPIILAFSTIGIYVLNSNPTDLYLMLAFGVLGYVFRMIEIPTAPLVLALVLGAGMEQSFRQSMALSGGSASAFFKSPISSFFIVLALVSVALPIILPRLRRFKGAPEDVAS